MWRYQRALWWFFLVSLLLSGFATMLAMQSVEKVAGHSLHGDRLYQQFDIFAFFELANNPEVALWSKFSGSVFFALIFFVFALFFTGGLLEAYRTERKLPAGEFFQACGAFFWRWVRLLIFMLIVLAPVFGLGWGINHWSGMLADDEPQEKLGFWVQMGGMLTVLLLLMAVRLWFDMAQVRAVAENERAMRRTFVRAFRLTSSNFRSLFWLYFRIGFLAWLGLVTAIRIWLRIGSPRVASTFLLFELLLLWWMGTRFWQRASETVWYERHAVVHTAPAPPPAPEMLPAEAYELPAVL